MSANVPLAKANHLGQPKVDVGGDYTGQEYTER